MCPIKKNNLTTRTIWGEKNFIHKIYRYLCRYMDNVWYAKVFFFLFAFSIHNNSLFWINMVFSCFQYSSRISTHTYNKFKTYSTSIETMDLVFLKLTFWIIDSSARNYFQYPKNLSIARMSVINYWLYVGHKRGKGNNITTMALTLLWAERHYWRNFVSLFWWNCSWRKHFYLSRKLKSLTESWTKSRILSLEKI